MEYSDYDRSEWNKYLINKMNSMLEKFDGKIDSSFLSYPLTGSKINFTGNDLFEFYNIICNDLKITLHIEDYYQFYTLNDITDLLLSIFKIKKG